MMKSLVSLAICALGFGLIGCSDAASPPVDDGIVDDRPDVPPVPEGATEYAMPEQVIEGGAEVQTCVFFEPLEVDTYFSRLESYQGKYGHHAILFQTVENLVEPGTVRDCTESSDMKSLIPLMSSVTFGIEQFPEGMAIKATAGTQLVIQSHQLNTTSDPIRVRDVLHAHTLDKSEVVDVAGFYGLSDIYFEVPAQTSDYQVEFDCVVKYDMQLLQLGGHMHEWGSEFYADVNGESFISVPDWKPIMRDEAPIVEWTRESAVQLRAGDVIHTDCRFNNTEGHSLIFPQEMCATFGYYFPAPEGEGIWTCDGTEE
jgi:hypothetical protein